MEKIKQMLVAGGAHGLTNPEHMARVLASLFSAQAISSSGWNVGAGLLVPRTGSAATIVEVNGITVRLAANTSAPALTGFNLTNGQHGAVMTTCDASGTLRNYFTNAAANAASISYPPIPGDQAVIGIVYFAPTVTFTGGTTALDAANVNALFVSVLGPFYPINTF